MGREIVCLDVFEVGAVFNGWEVVALSHKLQQVWEILDSLVACLEIDDVDGIKPNECLIQP